MTQDELNQLLRFWQDALELRDWGITAKLVHACELGAGHDGEADIQDEQMMAVIRVGIREEYKEEWTEDAEKTLVHELLHLHMNTFDKFDADSLQSTMIERAINHIARALTKVRRGEEGERRIEMLKGVGSPSDTSSSTIIGC